MTWNASPYYSDGDRNNARAVLDALLAYRDENGNRMVILASELEQVGVLNDRGFFYPRLIAGPTDRPVFVFRPPSGEPT